MRRTALNGIVLPLMLSFILALAFGVFSASAYLNSASVGLTNVIHPMSSNSSNQSDKVALSGNESLVQSSQNMPIGRGYYESNPISIEGGSGMRTVISNGDTAMSHEVVGASELDGYSEYSASSTAIKGAIERVQSASTNMKIDESVTDGRISIGVLSGDSQIAGGRFREGPKSSAWKSPTIEIDEEYVGTYHLSKNFSLSSSNSIIMPRPGWLSCFSSDCTVSLSEPKTLSLDEVFNCESLR